MVALPYIYIYIYIYIYTCIHILVQGFLAEYTSISYKVTGQGFQQMVMQ
jgi:hypothetical protein